MFITTYILIDKNITSVHKKFLIHIKKLKNLDSQIQLLQKDIVKVSYVIIVIFNILIAC